MNRKQLLECIKDEEKFLDYWSKEIMEAMEKYKKSVEILESNQK